MKKLIFLLIILFQVNFSWSQTFHFVNTTTTLTKTTDQSPAHWYIEIYNDVGVDTNLRWRAFFDNIPAAWQIDLDDQTNYTTDIQDGDSMDFVLQSGLTFPQKLIIGATLNGTPGVGSVYFEIYDPYDPTVIDTIEFRFVITQGVASLFMVNKDQWMTQDGETFIFSDEIIGEEISIFSMTGQEIYFGTVEKEMIFFGNTFKGVVFFFIEREEEVLKRKVRIGK